MAWWRALPLLVLVTLPVTTAEPGGEACEKYFQPGVGTVCELPDGLLQVFASDGSMLGTVHGLDPIPADDEPAAPGAPAPRDPSCANGSYYAHVIYARAYNDDDNYAQKVETIRGLVRTASGWVHESAQADGGQARLIVLCEASGEIRVDNVELPTPKGSAHFDTIVSDLKGMGYDDKRVKYWIYYDDRGACGCGGIGHVYNDDRASTNNYNNGNALTYSVTFGYDSARIMLHELGHNMGAVQLSSPHSSGSNGWHCNDGRDVMCYSDGGSTSNYRNDVCSTEDWDCNRDDYFNVAPAPGSYLDTHWNIGHQRNRFIDFGDGPPPPPPNAAPSLLDWSCPAALKGAPVTCSLRVSDPDGWYANIQWGDGASARAPASGTAADGATRQVTHTYGAAGTYTVTITLTDGSADALSSTVTRTLQVVTDNTGPVIDVTHPRGGTYLGFPGISFTHGFGRPVIVDEGRIVADVSDPAGVVQFTARLDNSLIYYQTGAINHIDTWFEVPTTKSGAVLMLEAWDSKGNRAAVSMQIDTVKT